MTTPVRKGRTGRGTATAATWLGLCTALLAPLLYVFLVGPHLLRPRLAPVAYDVAGLAFMWLCAGAVVAIALRLERRPLASIGLRRPRVGPIAIAAGIGVALSLLVPLLVFVGEWLVPTAGTGGIADAAASPVWLLVVAVITAGVTEEVLFRGYAIERLSLLTGRPILAALLPLAAFTAMHVPGWGWGHAVTVALPLGALLTLAYLWRRDLATVVIAHTLVDLPLIILAILAS